MGIIRSNPFSFFETYRFKVIYLMKQKFFRLLADLRFAIFILLLISFCSIIGTVIEQDQPIETYKLNYPLTNQVFGFLSWDRILVLGLDHVYQTWWFLTLICLFGISLISCTFLQQFPSLKIARRCQFFRTTVQFYRLKISTILNNLSFNKIVSRIKKTNIQSFSKKYCLLLQRVNRSNCSNNCTF